MPVLTGSSAEVAADFKPGLQEPPPAWPRQVPDQGQTAVWHRPKQPKLQDWGLVPSINLFWYTSAELEAVFEALSAQWLSETQFISSVHVLFLNRSYQRIIGLGRQALPILLRKLEEQPANWFWALECIAREDPAPADAPFADRTQAWLSWGRSRGYIG